MHKNQLTLSGGKILISQPSLIDRFFIKSVVMLAEHGPDGSFGFIVNKPASVMLSSVTNIFKPFDAELFLGGPVSMKSLFFVHSKGDSIRDSLKISEGVYWGGNMDDVKVLIDTGLISSSDIRFYAGYSGWQPKQLEQEMEDNSWIIMQPEMSYVFENKPNQLWKKLVKTLGSDFAPWINYPNDPNMN